MPFGVRGVNLFVGRSSSSHRSRAFWSRSDSCVSRPSGARPL